MGLLQEWREYAYGVELNSKEGKAIWDKYFEQEKAIYQQLLAAPEKVVSGTVQELAELKNQWCRLITVKAIGFLYPNIFSGSSIISILLFLTYYSHQGKPCPLH